VTTSWRPARKERVANEDRHGNEPCASVAVCADTSVKARRPRQVRVLLGHSLRGSERFSRRQGAGSVCIEGRAFQWYEASVERGTPGQPRPQTSQSVQAPSPGGLPLLQKHSRQCRQTGEGRHPALEPQRGLGRGSPRLGGREAVEAGAACDTVCNVTTAHCTRSKRRRVAPPSVPPTL